MGLMSNSKQNAFTVIAGLGYSYQSAFVNVTGPAKINHVSTNYT